jgi:hypothetical protein
MQETVALLRKAPLTTVMLGLCLSNLAGVHTERGELDDALARRARACRCWSRADSPGLTSIILRSVRRSRASSRSSAPRRIRGFRLRRTKDRAPAERSAFPGTAAAIVTTGLARDALSRLTGEGAALTGESAVRLALEG